MSENTEVNAHSTGAKTAGQDSAIETWQCKTCKGITIVSAKYAARLWENGCNGCSGQAGWALYDLRRDVECA